MGRELLIREVFRLSSGATVLACEGPAAVDVVAGRRACLLVDGQIRQRIVLTSERTMINQTAALNQRALETLDSVEILPEEVQSRRCELVLE